MRFRSCACGVLLLIGLALVGCQKEIPEELFLKGYKAFEQGDMIGAVLYFEKFMEKYPENEYCAQARLMMGRARVRLGEFEDAEKDFRMLVRKFPEKPEGVNAALELADYYARSQKQPEKAEQEIRSILDYVAAGTQQEFLMRAASYYVGAATEPEKAEKILKEIIDKSEDEKMKLECYRGIAQAYIACRTDSEKAVEALNQIVQMTDDDQKKVDAWFEMGQAYVGTNEFEKAIEIYQSMVDSDLPNPEEKAMAYMLMSKGYERLKEMGKALDCLERLRSEFPDTDVSVMSYIQTALYLKQSSPELSDEFFDKGISAYGRVKDESPESDRAAWAQMKIAESYALVGDATKAVDELGTAITEFPNMPQYVNVARNQIRFLRMQLQAEASKEEIESAT